MTPPTETGTPRRASGDARPLDDGHDRDSPLEGTSGIARGAAEDALRVATIPARLAGAAAAPVLPFLRAGAGAALGLAGRLAGRVLSRDEEAPPAREERQPRGQDEPREPRGARSADADERREADEGAVEAARRHGAAAAAAEPPPAAEVAPAPVAPTPAQAPEREHVSEEATLVGEFAERGAEDGAGAEVAVAEPWDGYASQPAAEVVRRLAGAGREELAAVQLYEAFGRKRRTVLDAAEKRMRKLDGGGS